MFSLRKDFPIFNNNSQLVYLDSASSSQKPFPVIQKTTEYISNSYANIGRGAYSIAEESDNLYFQTKEKIGKLINCKANEVFFSHNSSYCLNIIAQALTQSNYLKSGGEIILSIAEHHANILIWQKIADEHQLTIRWVGLDEDLKISQKELLDNVSDKTVLVALSLCSNVLGIKNNLKDVRKIIGQKCLFVVDASQAIPNYSVDVRELDCDMLIFSAHKFLAYTGLGVGYIKHNLIRLLKPTLLGGGIVEEVTTQNHVLKTSIEKFEVGTPNIISIVSLYFALEYRENKGGYDAWKNYENELINYTLDQCQTMSDKLICINPQRENRIGIFSFSLKNTSKTMNEVNEELNKHHICVRVGGHCAYPLANYLKITTPTLRLSLYAYNNKQDIEKFFKVLKDFL